MNRNTLFLSVGILAIACGLTVEAAKAPLSGAKLQAQASHVINGEVLEITSKTEKSKVETGFGSHVDRIFTIRVRVKDVFKGAKGVEAGDEIVVVAWKPERRLPPEPGLQGHVPIPKKGDRVTVFAKGMKGKAYEPLLPNGIVIQKP